MGLLFGICLMAGIFCLVYYGIITIYAGLGTAFAGFWICAGIGLLIIAFAIKYMANNEIKLPISLKFLIIVVASSCFSLFILLEGMIIYSSTKVAEPKADYLIVLGAQVRGTTITKSLKKRLDTATSYLASNPKTQVIVSGGKGQGEDISEAEAMRIYLMEKGIKEERIIIENQSTNTNENIKYSKQIIEIENPSVVIVTNGFHIFRATQIAKKQGIRNVQGLAAPSDQILILNYYVREAIGVIKDMLVGNM